MGWGDGPLKMAEIDSQRNEGVREKEQMGEEETEAVSLGKVSGRFCCVLVESREFQRGREVLGSYRVLEGWKPGEMEAAV